MDPQAIYEKWRKDRSRVEPSAGLAARVMQSISNQAEPATIAPERRRFAGLLRNGVCAAAVLAALFRVVELFTLFTATNLEN